MPNNSHNNLLEKALSLLDVAVLTVDTETRLIVDCNTTTETIFGYQQLELLGQSTRMLHVNEAMFQKFHEDKQLSDSFAKDGSFFTRYQMRRKNGEVFDSEHFVSGIKDGAGKVTKVISIVRDISDEIAKCKAINEAQTQIDLLVNHTPGVIYACKYDKQGSFVPVFCTPNMKGLMGYSPEDFYNQKDLWASNIHPVDSPRIFKEYDRLFVDDKLLHRYRWRHKDGHYIWVRDELSLLRDENGEPEQIVGVWVNIDEQKAVEIELERYKNNLEKIVKERTDQLHQAQDQLIQKERLAILGQLATTVSHELRNPLGTISNVIDLIDEALKQQNFGRVTEKLELAHRNIDRCDRIVNELLEFASGKEPRIETFQFDAWLQSVLDEIYYPPQINCELQLSAEMDVSLDPSLIHRAINNVVNNAIQALESVDAPDKTIRIVTTTEDDYLRITINDNGPGMSVKCLKHIFDPLFSTKTFGIGLGMSIVKNAVESLKGIVNIESSEGNGTSVTITIPI